MTKIEMRPEPFPRDFIFITSGKSYDIYTELSRQEVTDAFIEYGQRMYRYDKKKKKIILSKNFTVKLDTTKLDDQKLVSLKFTRYDRFLMIWFLPYVTSILFLFIIDASGMAFFIVFMAYLLGSMINTRISRIRGKYVDYSEEAGRIFLEVSAAVKEKSLSLIYNPSPEHKAFHTSSSDWHDDNDSGKNICRE
jgi:hypothetical protein